MTAKKVPFGPKPTSRASTPAEDADAWVETRAPSAQPKIEPEKMARLTIDIPVSLHRAIKAACAERGNKISDEIREMVIQKYRN